MTNDRNLFSLTRKLEKMLEIGLPDGSCNYVTESSDVMIYDDIMLHNVLFVLTFK